MSPNWNKLTPVVGLSVVLLMLAPRVAAAQLIWGLGENNHLFVFASSDPVDIVAEADITGLAPGEIIRAIDFRPRYGQLYGYGSTHRLYRINLVTGKATAIGGGVPLAITVDSGAEMGFDFDPSIDEIRIVTSTSQNFRIDPDTGAVIDGDPVTAGIQGDTPLTPAGAYVAAAYINNYMGTPATTLYAIDASADRFVRIGGVNGPPSPNLGAVTDIGPLGVNAGLLSSLDAAINPRNELYAVLSGHTLYTIDRTTGAATSHGLIGSILNLADIAVSSVEVRVYVLTADNHLLHIKNHPPITVENDVVVTGLLEQSSGEVLTAIDTRPATGQLYALSDRFRVYTIDPDTGVATMVGPSSGVGPIGATPTD